MEWLGIREFAYQNNKLRQVKHVTFDPTGPGVVRIHMVPPRAGLRKETPSVLIINGQDIIPLNFSWAVLLSEFIDALQPYENHEIRPEEWDTLTDKAIQGVRQVYPRVADQRLKDDLWTIISTLTDIAAGIKPTTAIGLISLGEYARYMTAPHRMDLLISSMDKDGEWHCNQHCMHCYAAGQGLAAARELSTGEWLEIIRKCRKAGIPQLTFTGGEPTLREDLVELVDSAKWFVTRLNTNGVLLTEDLCRQLAEASLDSVQITLYSGDPAKHNLLVGAQGWEMTVSGIRSALAAGLCVSVNTPLCTLNGDYLETLKFLNSLGVKYVSCSGLIPAGNAVGGKSADTRLDSELLATILQDANTYCQSSQMDMAFTSPGWLTEEKLREIGLTNVPACGACLSNMAVTSDGQVVPCQSWLSGETLGNMLADPWKKIWQGRKCREIRRASARLDQICQLQINMEKAGDSDK